MNDGIEAVGAFALIGIAGHQQDGQHRIVARGAERQRNAVHDRHADVGEQKVETPLLAHDQIKRIAAIACGLDLVPVDCQRPRAQRA